MPAPKFFKIQEEIDGARSSVDADFKDAYFKCDANFSLLAFKGKANFSGAVFKGHADFTNFEFHGKVDFTGAVFEDGASFASAVFVSCVYFAGAKFQDKVDFTGAVFEDGALFRNVAFLTQGEDVLFKDAVFQPTKNQITFQSTKFGLPYPREFGGWEIWFSIIEEGFTLARRKKNEQNKTPQVEEEFLGEFSDVVGLKDLVKAKGMQDASDDIVQSFEIFRNNPKDVSFHGARFGDWDLTAPFSQEPIQTVIDKEAQRVEKNTVSKQENQARREGDGPCEEIFIGTEFNNGGDVDFGSASFTNGGDVGFRFSSFTNAGDVGFCFSSFTNAGDVDFSSSTFTNRGSVSFGSAHFTNGGDVGFSSSTFTNGGDVDFGSSRFTNCGDVTFHSSNFTNGQSVDFSSSSFTNGRSLYFRQMIWANSWGLSWNQVNFKEAEAVKFDECLFLPGGQISFNEAQFPKDGSLMFQRCYFARTPEINFTGAFFRYTTFEGGEILWLKDQQDRIFSAILKERLKEKFDHLPKELKYKAYKSNIEIIEIPEFSRVFEQNMKVLWKDLTTESAKNLSFHLTNLSGSIFSGMTPTHIQLNAPKWLKEKGWFKDWFLEKGRNVLSEEMKLRANSGEFSIDRWRNIEDQYTQLKNNLEGQGNYLHAGDFHYGEQEIRREILRREGNWLNKINNFPMYFLTTLYKWLSGYGERPWRAASIFFILLFVLTLNNFIGYDSMRFDKYTSFWGLKVFKSFVHTVVPFSWKDKIKKIGISNLCFYMVFILGQLFLFLIQLPLMILAVRRRFKR